MLELGKKSEFYHSKLAKIINKTNIDKVFIYGDKIFKTYKNISNDKKGNILHSKQDFDLIFSKVNISLFEFNSLNSNLFPSDFEPIII